MEQEREAQHVSHPQQSWNEPSASSFAALPTHQHLDALRDASWQAAGDGGNGVEQAISAVKNAWARASARLPGRRPTLLGVLPSVCVLLPGNPQLPRCAGVLLLQVDQPPATQSRQEGQAMLEADFGLVPGLRLLVYEPQYGYLLQRCDWVLAERHALQHHPRFDLPAWHSGDGWTLLFPSTTPAQAHLFSCVLAIFGCERDQVPPGSPCFPVTPATEDQGAPESAAAATIAPVVPFPWQLDSSPAYSGKGQPALRAVAVQVPAGTTHPSLAWLQQGSVGLHHELGRRQPSHACGAVSSGTVLSSLGLEQGSSNLADAGCCWSGSMA